MLSASVAIAVGASIYVFGRDWTSVQFLAPFTEWRPAFTMAFSPVDHSLPSLTHAYAFSMLLILALWPARRARCAGAGAWLLLAVVLESLQSTPIQRFVATLPGHIEELPLGQYLVAYIANGRFDAMDLLATAVGVTLAYAASSVLEKQP